MLKTLSVSELSRYISNIFEAEELLQNIKVYGEVSGLSCVRGNLYFSLKDEGSLMPCIMFGANLTSVKEGDQVLATGSMKYYAKGGKLNFYVNSLMPYGSGILYQKFIELKNKLEAEGVFSDLYKKPLPKSIKKIGVITSKTGAVVHDIETVSHRRNPCLDIVVYPARVQGEGAEQTIINGLKYLDKIEDIDVIIIARGGGSIEDLQPFNTEILAREIIKTNKPVISAVGHETDFTICDFASSMRAATPSVAAELVSLNVIDKIEDITSYVQKIEFLVFNLIDRYYDKIDNICEKLSSRIDNVYSSNTFKFSKNIRNLYNRYNFYNDIEQKFNLNYNKLLLLNPISMLNNGWAKISKNNKGIKDVNKLKVDDKIEIDLKNGKLISTVNEIIAK